MPSENNPDVQYELFEDKKAIKFMDNHSDDENLIKRIYLNNARIPRPLLGRG